MADIPMLSVPALADKTGYSQRHIWRLVSEGRLEAHRERRGKRELVTIAADALDPKPGRQDELAALRLEVKQLRAEVEALKGLRVAAAQLPVPAALPPVARYDAILTASPREPARYDLGGGLPPSGRARARWVEDHGGPGWAWVRDFKGLKDWRTVQDVIDEVRTHEKWEYWLLRPCGNPSCICHELPSA